MRPRENIVFFVFALAVGLMGGFLGGVTIQQRIDEDHMLRRGGAINRCITVAGHRHCEIVCPQKPAAVFESQAKQ